MIEPAQLRRWKEGFDLGFDGVTFLVLGESGSIFGSGEPGRKPVVPLRIWRILVDGAVCGGWTDELLEKLSEALDGDR